jgi:hypothetical protein
MGDCNSFEDRVYPIKQVKLFKEARNCKLEVINPWKNKVLKNDGADLIGVEELLKNFNRLIVIKGYPSDWSGISFHSNFFSFGLPSSSNTEWTKNNQHLIMLNKPCYLRILMKEQEQAESQFGFLLFRA